MLIIKNVEHFNTVVAWAAQDERRINGLVQWLNYLRTYGGPRFNVELWGNSFLGDHDFNINIVFTDKPVDSPDRLFMNGGLNWSESSKEWSVNT